MVKECMVQAAPAQVAGRCGVITNNLLPHKLQRSLAFSNQCLLQFGSCYIPVYCSSLFLY